MSYFHINTSLVTILYSYKGYLLIQLHALVILSLIRAAYCNHLSLEYAGIITHIQHGSSHSLHQSGRSSGGYIACIVMLR